MCASTIVISAFDEPGLVRVRQGLSGRQLLAHALEDQDVRVDRHADSEHDSGEARERHRGADVGHDPEDDGQVDREPDHDRHDAARGVEGDHEGGDRREADQGGLEAARDRVRRERRADLVLVLDRQRDVQRVVEDVGEVERLALGERARDLAVAVDLVVDGRGLDQHAVEDDRHAPDPVAAVGDRAGDLAEALGALARELHQDLELPVGVHLHVGVGDHVPGHLRDPLDVELLLGPAVSDQALGVDRHELVAGRHLPRGRPLVVDLPELQLGGLPDVLDDVGIVLRADAGKLDLDPVRADRADQGLGDAEAVDARVDDLDRLRELLLALPVGVEAGLGPEVRLEGHAHAALQVEPELDRLLRAIEEVFEEDVVSLVEAQLVLEQHVREELRHVDLRLLADLLQGHVVARRGPGHDAGVGLVQERAEFRLPDRGLLLRVDRERDVLEGEELGHGPARDGEAQDDLPEVAFEHFGVGLKGVWPRPSAVLCAVRAAPPGPWKGERCSGGLLLLGRLPDDRLDESLADLDLRVVGHLHDESVVPHVRDDSVDAAVRHDLVAGLKRGEHLLVLLLLLLLRGDEHEVEPGEDEPHHQELNLELRAGGSRRACGRGCLGDHFNHFVLRSFKEKTRI